MYKYILYDFICKMVIHPKEENKAVKEGWDAGGRECNFRYCGQEEASPRK